MQTMTIWFASWRDLCGQRRTIRSFGSIQSLPECLDDFVDEDNPVRVIDVFVDSLDLAEMSFDGVEPAATGRFRLSFTFTAI